MDLKRKNLFATSDWHVGHANVLIFDQRPFKDLNHMHRVLVNNYNARVGNDDVCFFLGDMGMGKKEVLKKVISQLNGTKVLILGNHDGNTFSMYNQGFDVVMNSGIIYMGDKRISMSHCPLPGIPREAPERGLKDGENWHGERKNHRFMSKDLTVDYHLHGHVHKAREEKDRFTDRQFDVGVRANNYSPVSFSEIESWIANVQIKAKHGHK